MLDNLKLDLNKISWYLWIAVLTAAFSVFSLIYNPDFIYFGFITFAYGIVGHIVFSTYNSIDRVNKTTWVKIVLHIITLTVWLYFIAKLI